MAKYAKTMAKQLNTFEPVIQDKKQMVIDCNISNYQLIDKSCQRILISAGWSELLYDVIAILMDFGLRINEALELERWSRVGDKAILFTEKKSDKRIFEFNSLPLFYRNLLTTKRIETRFLSYDKVLYHIRQNQIYEFRLNGKAVATHIFRYRFAQKMYLEGLPIDYITLSMGHRDAANTLHYLRELNVFEAGNR